MRIMIVGLIIFLTPSIALSDPPERPLKNFESAKKVARDVIYSGHNTDFYCGCGYIPGKAGSGGTIDASDCGYTPRKNKARGKRGAISWDFCSLFPWFGYSWDFT